MTKEELANSYSYEFKEWVGKMQSFPVEEIEHCNRSRSYEMDVIHVFKLEDKNYAVVVESGCSCYSASDAGIEVFKTKKEAEARFETWESAHNNSYDEPCSCGKHKAKVE